MAKLNPVVVCKKCGEKFKRQHNRGHAPKFCPPCRQDALRRRAAKPLTIRNCRACGVEFTEPGSRRAVNCEECRYRPPSRSRNPSRAYTCKWKDCCNIISVSGTGHRKWCEGCKPLRQREIQDRHNAKSGRVQTMRFKRYGITEEAYTEMLAAQNHRCMICRTPEPGGQHGGWHIDHDHRCCDGAFSCGQCVRGILCNACNSALGRFGDDPERLERAAAYVRGNQLSLIDLSA